MNSTEQNAIKIAELIGLPTTPSNTFVFEYYDGLMPIVFECNSHSAYGDIFNISIYYSAVVIYVDSERNHTFPYNTESEFIEAIQLAVIKYLELKNG